jgi:hypothetical protein
MNVPIVKNAPFPGKKYLLDLIFRENFYTKDVL